MKLNYKKIFSIVLGFVLIFLLFFGTWAIKLDRSDNVIAHKLIELPGWKYPLKNLEVTIPTIIFIFFSVSFIIIPIFTYRNWIIKICIVIIYTALLTWGIKDISGYILSRYQAVFASQIYCFGSGFLLYIFVAKIALINFIFFKITKKELPILTDND